MSWTIKATGQRQDENGNTIVTFTASSDGQKDRTYEYTSSNWTEQKLGMIAAQFASQLAAELTPEESEPADPADPVVQGIIDQGTVLAQIA